MRKFLRCGYLFDGLSDDLKSDQTAVVEDGVIAFVGPTAEAPPARAGDPCRDVSGAPDYLRGASGDGTAGAG